MREVKQPQAGDKSASNPTPPTMPLPCPTDAAVFHALGTGFYSLAWLWEPQSQNTAPDRVLPSFSHQHLPEAGFRVQFLEALSHRHGQSHQRQLLLHRDKVWGKEMRWCVADMHRSPTPSSGPAPRWLRGPRKDPLEVALTTLLSISEPQCPCRQAWSRLDTLCAARLAGSILCSIWGRKGGTGEPAEISQRCAEAAVPALGLPWGRQERPGPVTWRCRRGESQDGTGHVPTRGHKPTHARRAGPRLTCSKSSVRSSVASWALWRKGKKPLADGVASSGRQVLVHLTRLSLSSGEWEVLATAWTVLHEAE